MEDNSENCTKCWKHPSILGTPLPKCKKKYKKEINTCPCDEKEDTLAQIIENTPELSLLNVAINVANLSDSIKKGEYTVFAPNDDAFKSIGEENLESLLEDEEQLAEILKLHIVSGKIESSDISEGESSINTLNGENINILNNGSDITVTSQSGSGGKVISPDIQASNGVIHIIDGVLLPSTSESMGGGNKKKNIRNGDGKKNTRNGFDSSVYRDINY